MSQNIIKKSDSIKRTDLVLDSEKDLERDHINGCLIQKFVCFYSLHFDSNLNHKKPA